jgi:hypothetical protein
LTIGLAMACLPLDPAISAFQGIYLALKTAVVRLQAFKPVF